MVEGLWCTAAEEDMDDGRYMARGGRGRGFMGDGIDGAEREVFLLLALLQVETPCSTTKKLQRTTEDSAAKSSLFRTPLRVEELPISSTT